MSAAPETTTLSLDFNKLPRSSRSLLVSTLKGEGGHRPILSDLMSKTTSILGWGFLAMVALGAIAVMASVDFGRYFGDYVQPLWMLGAYVFAAFVAVVSVLCIVRTVALHRALPFPPGRYLLPLDFIDARGRTLRIIPLSELADFNGTHHHTNGGYTHTELNFRFSNGTTESFTVRGKQLAEAVLTNLGSQRDRFREALEQRDELEIAALDPLFEARLSGIWQEPEPGRDAPVATDLPAVAQKRLVIATAVGAVLAAPTFFARNYLSDEEAFTNVRADNRTYAYEAYLRGEGRHSQEVRETHLPRAALDEAKEKGNVTALRDFLKEYPQSPLVPEARSAIHALFEKTLAHFKEQAASGDPKAVAFIERLLKFQEAHESPNLKVHFRAPELELLTELDTELAERELKIAPVAPHFDESRAAPREAAIVTALKAAFGRIFPGDVLQFESGARLSGDEKLAAATDNAVLEIAYTVAWSGATYTSQRDKDRNFVGILIVFSVQMRIPGEKEEDELRFAFAVRPPETFRVEFTPFMAAYMKNNAPTDGPSDAKVYEVMAVRAFDQLETRLRGVFFRPEEEDDEALAEGEGEEDEDAEE